MAFWVAMGYLYRQPSGTTRGRVYPGVTWLG